MISSELKKGCSQGRISSLTHDIGHPRSGRANPLGLLIFWVWILRDDHGSTEGPNPSLRRCTHCVDKGILVASLCVMQSGCLNYNCIY